MIDSHETLRLITKDGQEFTIEVNYLESDKECKTLRCKYDQSVFYIDREDLVNALLVIGTPSQQKKLMPVTVNNVRKLERMLTFEVKLTKNYSAGDKVTIQAPWIDTITDTEAVFAQHAAKKGVMYNKKLIA